MLTMFKEFLNDDKAWDMYVTGAAGTGKTTNLREAVEYCIEHDIGYTVCAFTHKACSILREKLPGTAKVQTLHSFLNKRPTINTDATHSKKIQRNVQVQDPDKVRIIFIDEWSMVGEQDLMDIRALQDEDYDGSPEAKAVWLGDPHQLPPVGDVQAVKPQGKYDLRLTKQYRNDNELQQPLNQLISFIEGEQPTALVENSRFIRGRDIVEEAKACTKDHVVLAYTNRRVEELNIEIQGRPDPVEQDYLFCPQTRELLTFGRWVEQYAIEQIDKAHGEPLVLGTKYKTLEHLLKMPDIAFAECYDEEGSTKLYATVFGHYQYKQMHDILAKAAAESNKAIEKEYKGYKAAAWAKANAKHPLARTRAKAWRDFLTFNDCVVCIDFPHAMTVHKSQGSTYEVVFLDTDDLYIAANIDFQQYLKLMYVAISRAQFEVITC